MKTAIIGGGAAGFFLAINLKEMAPDMDVTIFEQSKRVLSKVEISGGGRCNCTNTFAEIKDLSLAYPRGHRVMKRLMNGFSQRDAYEWFENHGVKLVVQPDQCVFPAAQDSHAIIDCFTRLVSKLNIKIVKGHKINDLKELNKFDFIAVTVGGKPRLESFEWLTSVGHKIEPPVPSLFTFSIADKQLKSLMGTVAEEATAFLPGTKLKACGPLLITHWGMSGPAVLKLSSYGARLLNECGYRHPLAVNWASKNEEQTVRELQEIATRNPQKHITSIAPFNLSTRLWQYLVGKTFDFANQKSELRWCDIGKKQINKLVNTLCNDTYDISGRAPFKDEFVTCGGISLSSVNISTLESRHVPNLFFAGEVLDIDGITGGFNFQAAWTTAYTVACEIARRNEM